MKRNNPDIPGTLLHQIEIDGMHGRYAVIPAKETDPALTRRILLLYGSHSSLERMYSTGQYLSRFGTVTMLDMPGFGGMDSFYSVGIKPSINTYGDYLQKAVKQVYGDESFTAMCMSLSFLFYARAMQLNECLAVQTDKLFAFVGFLNKSDFRYGWLRQNLYSSLTWLFSRPPATLLARLVLFNRYVLGTALRMFFILNPHYKSANKFRQEDVQAMERDLWLRNDLRTHFKTVNIMLNARFPHKRIEQAVVNIGVDKDQYFDSARVEKSMRQIFSDYKLLRAEIGAHAPSIVSSEEEVATLMPAQLETEMRQA